MLLPVELSLLSSKFGAWDLFRSRASVCKLSLSENGRAIIQAILGEALRLAAVSTTNPADTISTKELQHAIPLIPKCMLR